VSSIVGKCEAEILRGKTVVFSGKIDNQVFSEFLFDDFGEYSIKKMNTEENFTFFYTPPELSQSFLLVELNINSKMVVGFQNNGLPFLLRFQNRNVKLNYFFVSREQSVVKSVKVLNGKKELKFTGVQKSILPNNRIAYKVTSMDSFPLYKVFLNSKMVAVLEVENDDFLKENKRFLLPKPEINRIKGMIIENKEIYYSDMYVYY
jgi:hypothetical protein